MLRATGPNSAWLRMVLGKAAVPSVGSWGSAQDTRKVSSLDFVNCLLHPWLSYVTPRESSLKVSMVDFHGRTKVSRSLTRIAKRANLYLTKRIPDFLISRFFFNRNRAFSFRIESRLDGVCPTKEKVLRCFQWNAASETWPCSFSVPIREIREIRGPFFRNLFRPPPDHALPFQF
jgi:hypothetical protein